MFSAVNTAIISGVKSILVTVETDASNGLPGFEMVGDLNSQVKESKERVRTAIKNSGLAFLTKHIVINIYPANIRKEGCSMDLAIAVGILTSFGYIEENFLKGKVFVGELGLDGKINPINGIMSIVSEAAKAGFEYCIVPEENLTEAGMIQGITSLGAANLKEVFDYLTGNAILRKSTISRDELFKAARNKAQADFADVAGQFVLRRVCEIGAAGMHNIMMIGPPGSGKTMVAKRIPGILPEISLEEAIEISSLYSLDGQLPASSGLIGTRPFREVHHTITEIGLIGGSRRMGEVTLGHKGVLFLDEFAEFDRDVIETLRQPLENQEVIISKANGTRVYPADFMLVAAMNPCKCGYYPDMNKCRCTSTEIKKYLGKLSGPMLDRIDLCVEAPKIAYSDFVSDRKWESSASIRERVTEAQKLQKMRFKDRDYDFNSRMTSKDIKEFCRLDESTSEYLGYVFGKLDLSSRSYNKLLKVARTIADLDVSVDISLDHVKEALLYRGLDSKYYENIL